MEERFDNRGDEPSTTQPSQPASSFFYSSKKLPFENGKFFAFWYGNFFLVITKAWAICHLIFLRHRHFSKQICFDFFTETRWGCCKKIKWQTAKASAWKIAISYAKTFCQNKKRLLLSRGTLDLVASWSASLKRFINLLSMVASCTNYPSDVLLCAQNNFPCQTQWEISYGLDGVDLHIRQKIDFGSTLMTNKDVYLILFIVVKNGVEVKPGNWVLHQINVMLSSSS